jgi:hypothetical protein
LGGFGGEFWSIGDLKKMQFESYKWGFFFLLEKNGSKSLYFEENKMKFPYFLDNNFQHVINTS